MDQANIVIHSVRALKIPQLEIEASDGKKYIADLSRFNSVSCFPKSQSEWENVGITTYGFNLTWASRFEVHIDQVIDTSISSEMIKLQA